MKPLIIGDGILGSEFIKQTGWKHISRKKDGFDITNLNTFHLLYDSFEWGASFYHPIINCIGNTDTYSSDREAHWKINVSGVKYLIDFCNQHGIKLVHISTDFIYAGSVPDASEIDVPVHQATWYGYTKLIGDALIQLECKDFLICRGTHKPKPFPWEKAWIDQIGNFEYPDVTASLIIKLIEKGASGVFNIGTGKKSMYELAKMTRQDVIPVNASGLTPKDLTMNISKLNEFLK